MVSPLSMLARLVPGARQQPPTTRCVMCGDAIRGDTPALALRGGLLVHAGCATYRVRQLAQRS